MVNPANQQNVYLGAANGGVWKSLDGGNTWTPTTDTLANIAIGSLAISADGTKLFAGTGEANQDGSYHGFGLLESTDAGNTWTTLGSSVFSGSSISGVALNPSNSNRLVVATTSASCCDGYLDYNFQSGTGIFVSSDGGITWTKTLNNGDYHGIPNLVADPNNPNTLYAGDYQGVVWISKDDGTTWSQLLSYNNQPSLQGRVAVAVTPVLQNTVFVAFSSNTGYLGSIYKDNLASNTLSPLSRPPNPPYVSDPCGSNGQCGYDLVLAVDPSNSSIIYFGGVDLYRSTNGGVSWTDLGGYLPGSIHPDQHALAFLPTASSTIFVGNDGGIWKSTDRGSSWTDLNAGLSITQFYSIAASPTGNGILGGTQDNGCVKYSGSVSWSLVQGGDGTWVGIDKSNPNTIYCVATYLNFQMSTDGGTTWFQNPTGFNSGDSSEFRAPFVQDPSSAGTLYAGSVRVYKSTNYGQSWSDLSGVISSNTITALAIAPTNSQIMYLCDSGGFIRVSGDGGHTWKQTFSQSYHCKSVAVDPANPSIAYAVFPEASPVVFKTSNGGSSWTSVSPSSAVGEAQVIRISSSGTLYLGTATGVLYSSNGGSTWATLGSGLPPAYIRDIAFTSSGQIIAATYGRGVWTTSPPGAVSITVSYIVVGGGLGYSAPTISYYSNGQSVTAQLSTSPTTYNLDSGTVWTIPSTLLGSSASERWATNQVTSGTASSSLSLSLTYYHQYQVAFSFSIAGGGTGYSSPSVTILAFGSQTSTVAGFGSGGLVWADSGSTYVYQTPLSGSSATERWDSGTPSGNITGVASVSATYYHQYLLAISYSVIGGGTPGAPTISFTSKGTSSLTVTLASSPSQVWVDSGSAYSISNQLSGSSSTERWQSGGNLSGTASSPTTLSLSYYHQYPLTTSYSIQGGGNPSAPQMSFPSFGVVTNASLTRTTTTNWVDSGGQYTISTLLGGSIGVERWQTNARPTGVVSQPTLASIVYYHQYAITVSLSVIGGGAPQPPTFSFTSLGVSNSINISNAASSVWADSGPFSATNPLVGSTSTERWYSPGAVNGTVTSPGNISLSYYHQFFMTIKGGSLPSQWYNAGSTATISPPAVYGRTSGTGFRIVSYTVDGGTAVAVQVTSGTLNVQVVMDSPHVLNFNSIPQYEVALDSGAKSGLNFITSPTISSDDYWYDAGSSVKVVLNGIWGRANGSGSRLASYTINYGAAVSVASNAQVMVLSLPSISTPQSITTTTMTQYLLKSPSGSVNSATSTPILGDAWWYDQGTGVKIDYNYVWSLTANQSRLNAISYDLDGGMTSILPRASKGTFAVTVTMNRSHTVEITSVTQYHFAALGGFNTKISAKSPTGDEFYDSGMVTTVTTNYTWGVVKGNTRLNLASYVLNGKMVRIARMDSGTYLTPSINLTEPTLLEFNAVPQYFVSFLLTDRPGSTQIVPTSFKITVNGSVQAAVARGAWFDNKSLVGVASVIWESAEVKPTTQNLSTINGPGTITIHALVFSAKLAISDFLGFPVGGANVEVALANGTMISGTTDSNGILNLGLIPIGTFQAFVTNLGFATQISGDATNREVVPRSIAVSIPTLTVTITAIIVITVFLVAIMVRRSRMTKSRRPLRRQGGTLGRQAVRPAR